MLEAPNKDLNDILKLLEWVMCHKAIVVNLVHSPFMERQPWTASRPLYSSLVRQCDPDDDGMDGDRGSNVNSDEQGI